MVMSSGCIATVCCVCSEDVDFDAFARDLQSFFTELESLNSSLVLTADASAGGLVPFQLPGRKAVVSSHSNRGQHLSVGVLPR